MSSIRRLIDFYRLQIELLWKWRPGRRALLRRMVVALVGGFVALWLTVALLPGLTADSLVSILTQWSR